MKIICVGRNYAQHAKELGNEVPTEPVLFLKPDTSLLRLPEPFFIPDFSDDVHYEAEIVVRIDRIGKNIEPRFAHKYYKQFSLGIDFTARDLQQKLKSKGLPWEKAKAFDRSAVLGKLLNKEDFDLANLNFSLDKNGTQVQKGNTNEMLFKIDVLIAQISSYFTLKIGDLIYTGTPAGVGPVATNDRLLGKVADQTVFEVKIK